MTAKKKTVKITVEALPLSLNKWERIHYHVRHRVKKHWIKQISDWILTQHPMSRFRAIGGLIQHANITITYYFPTRHQRDADNSPPKCILDALKGQIILDDSPKVIDTLNVRPDQYDKDNPRTEIEIEELDTPRSD